jgi:hypothetical protein
MFVRQTLQESIHVEVVRQPRLFLVAAGRLEELLVRIEQASKASHECCPYLLWVKCSRTHQTDLESTSAVYCSLTSGAFVHAFFGPFITHAADSLLVKWLYLQAMPLNQASAFGVMYRLCACRWNNRRCGHGRLSVHRGRIRRARTVVGVQRGDGKVGCMAKEGSAGPPGDALA